MIIITKDELDEELQLTPLADIGHDTEIVLEYRYKTTYFLWVAFDKNFQVTKITGIRSISGVVERPRKLNINLRLLPIETTREDVIDQVKTFLKKKP